MFVIATPYVEGSVLAFARTAARREELARFYTTLHTDQMLPVKRYVPTRRLKEMVQKEAARRAFAGIPSDDVETATTGAEMLSILLRRVPKAQALASRAMYYGKDRFDRAVASRVRTERADVVVTMYASAAFTLAAARDFARLGVLNFVNSHPNYQNALLHDLAGLKDGHHELVPGWVAHRVDREIELADCILVPSQFVARQLEEIGVPRERVVLAPYGVDLSAFRPSADQSESRARRLVCLYIGQMSHRKGVPLLINAARRLRGYPIRFLLAGPLVSPEVLANLPENVSWQGRGSHAAVAELMRSADVFVLPSLEDAYGLVTLEAMASALPVVVSDHTGSSELISDGADGLVVPAGSVDALVEAITALLTDADRRREMGSAARRRVEEGYSWDEYGERVLDTLNIRTRARTTA